MPSEGEEKEDLEVWVGLSVLLEVGADFVDDVFVCGISNSDHLTLARPNIETIEYFD